MALLLAGKYACFNGRHLDDLLRQLRNAHSLLGRYCCRVRYQLTVPVPYLRNIQISVTGDIMHRIDTPTAQKDKFGVGKNGFTAGNPQTGTPATDLDNDYFDMLQEELAGVVEATGVNLDKSKHNQLLTALKALFLSRAHPFADIRADGAATIAEALSNLGLKDVVLAGTMTGVFDTNGYLTIPAIIGGDKRTLIIQWGQGNNTASATSQTNFLFSFPLKSVRLWLLVTRSPRIFRRT